MIATNATLLKQILPSAQQPGLVELLVHLAGFGTMIHWFDTLH